MTDLSDKPIKVILVGDQGVGKTNLINVSIGLMFNDKEQICDIFEDSWIKIKV